MNKKYQYYGVYGNNGYGVYTSRYRLAKSEVYISRPHIKGFNNFDEAFTYAFEGFRGYCNYYFDFHAMTYKEKASLNYFYFIKSSSPYG